MTIWCPSTAAIQRMNAHVEEDIQLAQEELSALAAKGRDCQHLLKCELSSCEAGPELIGDRSMCAVDSEILLGCKIKQSTVPCYLSESTIS